MGLPLSSSVAHDPLSTSLSTSVCLTSMSSMGYSQCSAADAAHEDIWSVIAFFALRPLPPLDGMIDDVREEFLYQNDLAALMRVNAVSPLFSLIGRQEDP